MTSYFSAEAFICFLSDHFKKKKKSLHFIVTWKDVAFMWLLGFYLLLFGFHLVMWLLGFHLVMWLLGFHLVMWLLGFDLVM